MLKSKLEQEKMQVVTEEKVSVRKTLLNLSIGEEREFSCTDFPLSRCRVIASQIKKGSNHRFSIRSNKYGTAFFVTRLR